MKSHWRALLLALCIVIIGFFAVQTAFRNETSPSVLRLGILPDQSKQALEKRYAPFLKYLSAKTGVNISLVLPSGYDELVQLFRDRKIELAYFGGLTFVQAETNYAAVPLVMREVDTRFTSSFLVRDGYVANDFADFKGKRFSFGNQLSTSGHLMPRHFMQTEKQLIPEEFFSEVHYSSTHDKTAYLVRDGLVELGVANTEIIKSMILDGRLKDNDLRILWQTPPYTDYVWAVHKEMNENLKTQLRDAFLELRANNPAHSKIMETLNAEFFLPAGENDFRLLEQIADSLGLLDTKTK